jgi:hypothetical protein
MATSHSTAYRVAIKDFPGYAVSRDGKVWSCRPRNGRGDLEKTWRELKWNKKRDGHMQVSLQLNNKQCYKMVHRLVLEAFDRPCPQGMEGCHKDGDPSNNQLVNLRWGTPKENHQDKVKHGTDGKGERNPNAVLTETDVLTIKKRIADGEVPARVAKDYHIHRNTTYRIRDGGLWKHI